MHRQEELGNEAKLTNNLDWWSEFQDVLLWFQYVDQVHGCSVLP